MLIYQLEMLQKHSIEEHSHYKKLNVQETFKKRLFSCTKCNFTKRLFSIHQVCFYNKKSMFRKHLRKGHFLAASARSIIHICRFHPSSPVLPSLYCYHHFMLLSVLSKTSPHSSDCPPFLPFYHSHNCIMISVLLRPRIIVYYVLCLKCNGLFLRNTFFQKARSNIPRWDFYPSLIFLSWQNTVLKM